MDIYNATSQSQSNGSMQQSASPATPGLLGGMDLTTISALVVLASAFMRR